MKNDVIHDPIFQHLLSKLEASQQKLQNSVIALRGLCLTHNKKPLDDTIEEKWRFSLLEEDIYKFQHKVEKNVGALVRYAFEIMPNNNMSSHLEEINKLKEAHKERIKTRSGWGKGEHVSLGFDEKVTIDDGPPITITIKPSKWEYTEKAKRAKELKKLKEPAINKDNDKKVRPNKNPHIK
jgi:hypothetical protein